MSTLAKDTGGTQIMVTANREEQQTYIGTMKCPGKRADNWKQILRYIAAQDVLPPTPAMDIIGTQIGHACQGVWMLLSQHTLAHLHHHYLEHLCILPAALVLICGCKIGHVPQGVWMLLSQY